MSNTPAAPPKRPRLASEHGSILSSKFTPNRVNFQWQSTHRLKDKAEAAYARGDLFEKRRRLMQDWSDFCARPAKSGEVVHLVRAAV